MPQIIENFFENILFRYESCSCDCVEDIEHITPGKEPVHSYKLQALQMKRSYLDMPQRKAWFVLPSTVQLKMPMFSEH